MKIREFKCVEILTDLIENHGLVSIKTSFEDEGAMFYETVRQKEICNQAKSKIVLTHRYTKARDLSLVSSLISSSSAAF
jgi:hypothetical protein